jgi:hypothetical protein
VAPPRTSQGDNKHWFVRTVGDWSRHIADRYSNICSSRVSTAGVVVSDALAIAGAMSCTVTVLLMVGAPTMLHSMAPSMPAEMLGHAVDYVRIRALGLPLGLAYSVMQVCLTTWLVGWLCVHRVGQRTGSCP